MTQNEQILAALEHGEELTPLDAMRRYGVSRLAARIYDLRLQGHDIMERTVRVPNRQGRQVRVSAYRIAQPTATMIPRTGLECPRCQEGSTVHLHHSNGRRILRQRVCRNARCHHVFTSEERHEHSDSISVQLADGAGIACPVCKTKTFVIGTYNHGTQIRRRRRCPACDEVFHTRERYTSEHLPDSSPAPRTTSHNQTSLF